MTSNITKRIIDADGHIAEDAQAIIAYMPEAYREKARMQPFTPFPPFDHLHDTRGFHQGHRKGHQ